MERSTQADEEHDDAAASRKDDGKSKKKAQRAADKARAVARDADSWLTRHLAAVRDGTSPALAAANIAAAVGLSAFVGFKAYKTGRIPWAAAGVGLAACAAVGLVEGVFIT